MKQKLKDGMYVRAPKEIKEWRSFVVPNTVYKVCKVSYFNNDKNASFRITTKEGESIYCLLIGCAHLANQDWEIVKERKIFSFFEKLFKSDYYWSIIHILAGIGLGYLLFKYLS